MRWLWQHYGDDPAEVDELERQIVQRLREAASEVGGEPNMIEGASSPHEGFLQYRFGDHLRNYRYFSGKYALAFTILSLTIIASGLLSSGIAAGWLEAPWARWTILVLGVTAGAAATINQLWRPGDKAVSRTRGANALCAEAWAYIERRGRYRLVADESEAFGLFVDEVSRIVLQAAAIDETRVDQHHPQT